MAQVYAHQCRKLYEIGKLTTKLLLAYKRTGRLTQEEYDELTALLNSTPEAVPDE